MRWIEISGEAVAVAVQDVLDARSTSAECPIELVPIEAYPAVWKRLVHAQRDIAEVIAHFRALGLDVESWQDSGANCDGSARQ